MSSFKVIESNKVFSVSVSHERCDGTHNVYIKMRDGSEIELFNISRKIINQVEYNLTHPDMSIRFDSRFLTQSENQWLAQNGINK